MSRGLTWKALDEKQALKQAEQQVTKFRAFEKQGQKDASLSRGSTWKALT